MKTYFVTVSSAAVAAGLDQQAVLVATLRPTEVMLTFCCQQPVVGGMLPERYIFKIRTTATRKEVKKTPGVVRVRTSLVVRQSVSSQVC